MKEMLELETVTESQSASDKKRRIEERRRQKRRIEGAIFLEIILQKIWEYEQGELFDGILKRQRDLLESGENKETGSGEDCLCFMEDGCIRERMVPTGDILEIGIPGLRQAVERSYQEVMRMISLVRKICDNPCYAVSNGVMERFYTEAATLEETVCAFLDYCTRRAAYGWEDFILSYEYFSHENARWAVRQNNEEGQHLIGQCGLDWGGTSYYHAKFYYKWEEMQRALDDAAAQFALQVWEQPFLRKEIWERTRFGCEGGLSFHGVWQYAQRDNNYPENQYGFFQPERKPPAHYCFLYRNYYEKAHETCLRPLLRAMEANEQGHGGSCRVEGIGVEERAYHNGRSYLVYFKPQMNWGKVKKSVYEQAMKFTENFRLFRVRGCMECLLIAEEAGEQTVIV